MIPLQLVLARPASGFEGPIAWEAIQATLEASARRLVQAGALLQIVPPGADPARLASALLTQGAANHEAGFVRLVVGSGPVVGPGPSTLAALPSTPTWTARVCFAAARAPASEAIASTLGVADWHIPAEVGPRPLTESDRLQILANTLGLLADLARTDDARPALATAFEALAAHGTLLVSQARLPLRAHRDALVKRYASAIARRWRDDLRLQDRMHTNDFSDALPALGAPPVSLSAALAPVAHALGARFAAAPAATAAEVHAAAVTDVRRLGQAALASLAAWCDDLRRAVDHALEAQNLAALAPLRRALAARMDALAPPTAPAAPAGPAPFASLPSRAALDAAEAALAACPAPIAGLAPLDLAWATGGATLAALALGPAVPDLRILSQVPGEGWTVVGLGAALLGLSATVGVRALSGRRRRRAARDLDRAQNAYRAMWIDDLTDHTRALAQDVEARLTALARRALEAEYDHVAAALQAIQQTATELEREPPWPRPETRAFDRTLPLDALRDRALPSVADVPPPALGESSWREHLAACTAPALEASARRVIGDGPLLAERRDLVDRLLPAVREAFGALSDQLQRWVPAGAPARRLWASPASIADAAPAGALQSAGEIYLAVYWPQLGEEPHDA